MVEQQQFLRNIEKRYHLLEEIGSGGMGTVYRAYDRLNAGEVAFKQVRLANGDEQANSTPSGDTSQLRHVLLALAQEFRTLVGLRHPHIVSVYTYGFDVERQPYFTMHLVEGAQTILEYAAEREQATQVRVLVELLQALAYLHQRGILHRDLKPANVLVSGEGVVKVMDFGLALSAMQKEEHVDGPIVGTLLYLAPELLFEEPASTASDLYAVGVMAYELFVGRHPFQGADVTSMITRIATEVPDTTMLPAHLAATLNRLLAKKPEERYASAELVIAELCDATGYPAPREDANLRDSFLSAARFVGRQRELEQLKQGLSAMLDGRGSAWLIGGESGVGKSRLLDELRTWALVRGALVLRGQALAGGGSNDLLTREPLRRLILFSEVSDIEAGILRDIIPDIETLLEREIPVLPPQPDSAQKYSRLFLTILNVFKRQQQPIVLLLEDLHWVEDTVELIRLFSQAAPELALLVIGTYRDDERPDLPAQLPDMQVMKLPRFDDAAIVELSTAVLGEAGKRPELIRLLKRETEGNVFFLIEVLRALAEGVERLSDVGKRGLPQTVFAKGIEAVVRQRLKHLPLDDQPMLRLAAVTGRQIRVDILRQVDDELDYDAWLLRSFNASILGPVEGGGWEFAHEKLREGILENLSAEERPRLHRMAAEAIEAAYPNDISYDEMLVRHWNAAGDSEREFYYTSRIVERLYLTSNFKQALMVIGRSLFQFTEDTAQLALLKVAGDAYVALGDTKEAETSYSQSLELAQAAGDRKGEAAALFGLTRVADARADYEAEHRYLEASMKIAREIGDQRGIASNLRGMGWNAEVRGDYEQAFVYLQDALAVCQETHDQSGQARTYAAMGFMAGAQANYGQAQAYIRDSLSIAREIGERFSVARALRRQGWLACAKGDYALAQESLNEALALARQIGDFHGISAALSVMGVVRLLQGKYDHAKTTIEESLEIGNQIREMRSIARDLSLLGWLASLRGNSENALGYLQESLKIRRDIGYRQGIASSLSKLGLAYAATGDKENATEVWREGLKIAHEIGAPSLVLDVLVGYARLCTPARGAEIAGFVSQHPALTADIQQTRLEALTAALREQLAPQVLKKGLKRGETLDEGQLVHEVVGM